MPPHVPADGDCDDVDDVERAVAVVDALDDAPDDGGPALPPFEEPPHATAAAIAGPRQRNEAVRTVRSVFTPSTGPLVRRSFIGRARLRRFSNGDRHH